MDKQKLGWNAYFENKWLEGEYAQFIPARIGAVDRDAYRVLGEYGDIPAEITGKLRYTAESSMDLPAVGDWVAVQYIDDGQLAVIHAVLPRRTFLRRKSAGRTVDYQIIAANIDAALIVVSCDTDFSVNRVERYIVVANEGRVVPVVLMSKIDLIEETDLNQRLSELNRLGDYRVIPFSNRSGVGLDAIRGQFIPEHTYCALGSSGVGKTTLLNHFLENGCLSVRAVRESDSKGRHTTTRRQLIFMENGANFIDTPGMRELGTFDIKDGLTATFEDIYELVTQCRYSDCSHIDEAGCAVVEAVNDGRINAERYLNFLKIRREAEYLDASYVEKRRKDKQFGKMVKQIMKEKKLKR